MNEKRNEEELEWLRQNNPEKHADYMDFLYEMEKGRRLEEGLCLYCGKEKNKKHYCPYG